MVRCEKFLLYFSLHLCTQHFHIALLPLHPLSALAWLTSPTITSPFPFVFFVFRTDDEQLRELQRSRQRLPSDSHMPNRAKSETRMDVQNSQRWNKYKSWDNEKEAQKTFDTYKRLITPGFYGSRKQMSKSHDELRYFMLSR